jgi:interleukin-1 receptor-associated kinase 1
LSVSVCDAARNPEAPYAVATSMAFDLGEMLAGDRVRGQIGLFSSVGQLAQLQSWNLTVHRPLPKQGSQKWVVVLSSVLGSVAATLVAATAVYCYLNSKYRRWKKELDELAKTMQSLPGVPMHIDFADIKKATDNFDDAMKLGRGGFGAVYGCVLPAAASRTGQAIKVAIKKFTRELQDHRYQDFLAEVSVINRLRHKNVVPLVGMCSYPIFL